MASREKKMHQEMNGRDDEAFIQEYLKHHSEMACGRKDFLLELEQPVREGLQPETKHRASLLDDFIKSVVSLPALMLLPQHTAAAKKMALATTDCLRVRFPVQSVVDHHSQAVDDDDTAAIQEAPATFVLNIFVVSKARDDGLHKQAGIDIEGAKVLFCIPGVAHACTYLMGLIYAMELSYPKKLKYTFEVFLKIFLELEDMNKKMSSKVHDLKMRLKDDHRGGSESGPLVFGASSSLKIRRKKNNNRNNYNETGMQRFEQEYCRKERGGEAHGRNIKCSSPETAAAGKTDSVPRIADEQRSRDNSPRPVTETINP
ncbi:hypothetical protein L3Q82_002043 [Scortum barcoo]|uniref:Uncharacterized protein n=1 Tax=Scortum barcoo TaxID=214431 RepID=A0ACB8W129_9TELE|nr:hypothetical protein L3Q82_002043 [Scortum barcoo]